MNLIMNIADSGFKIDSPLALPEDEVQLWRVDLEAIRSDESRWQRVLSPDESKRASRFHLPSDRQRFVASRALLRTILAAYLAADSNDLSFSYSDEEKPSLGSANADSGIRFNVSHSGRIALYAFTRRREIGVDVEQVRRDFVVEAIARRFFPHVSRANSLIFATKRGLTPSSVAGRVRKPISRRLGKVCLFPLPNSMCPSGPWGKARCSRRGRMVQKQDVGFSVKCRQGLAISPLSASVVKVGN